MSIVRGAIHPTNIERTFHEDEFIVSKTDLSGRITYANEVFLKVAEYTEEEVLGAPHSLVRHPDMPRCVFQLLWDTIQSGNEIFAYVKNMTKRGDYYWVLAHATPSMDENSKIIGYHSNRRVPSRRAVTTIEGIYKELLREEQKHSSKADAIKASVALLQNVLSANKVSYSEFVFSLGE